MNKFDRPINYLEGSYQNDLKQSMQPGMMLLDQNYANRKYPKRIENIGYIGTQGDSLSKDKNLMDIDSELRIKYRATRDPFQKFRPPVDHKDNNHDFCDANMNVDYTRYSNPVIFAPVHAKNRFEPLYLNPQEVTRWRTPFLIGEQTRWAQR